ncbi:MAG: gas vesicle protein [Planctomycetota bacterium]|jgi:gas vesicle protein
MSGICKKIIRTAVIGGALTGAAVGATVLIAGPDRAKVIFDQVQESVVTSIDEHIDDPIAMRAQLRKLEGEYPERIKDLRGDLAELQEQIRQLNREKKISERVVDLAKRDLDSLAPALASNGGNGLANVSLRQGYEASSTTRSRHIRQTQAVYSNRAAEASHDLVYLRQQEERMVGLLEQIEAEYANFQVQIWQLERQVDAIARNDRLIDLMADRQKTIDELSSFEVVSLDHMVSRLSEMRSRQEAELEVLSTNRRRTDYESMARMDLVEEEETYAERNLPTAEGLVQIR